MRAFNTSKEAINSMEMWFVRIVYKLTNCMHNIRDIQPCLSQIKEAVSQSSKEGRNFKPTTIIPADLTLSSIAVEIVLASLC